MKTKHICTCFFSFFSSLFFAQTNQEAVEDSKMPRHYTVGFDVLNGAMAAFSNHQLFQGFVSTNIKKKWYAVVDVGFEKNKYDKNGYDAVVSGPLFRVGGLYMLASDQENPQNGFFGGAKLAASFYQQEYHKVPIRGSGNVEFAQAFPKSSQSSYWLEANIGGRVQLFETPFYIEVTAQPKYLLFTTKQDDIFPMIVPGFGKSASKFNMGFSWNLAFNF